MDFRNNNAVVSASSGNVAAGTATATLPAVVGRTTYIAGFCITGGGATAASVVNATITNITGGTQTYNVAVPAGATLGIAPLFITFDPPLSATAVNTSVVVSIPSLGTGNTNTTVNAWGYQV